VDYAMAQTPDTGTVSSMSCVIHSMTPQRKNTVFLMLAGGARLRSSMRPRPSLSVVGLALLRRFRVVEWSTRLIWAEELGTSAGRRVRLQGSLQPDTFGWFSRTVPT